MKAYGWFGLLLLLVSEYCLFRRIEPFTTWFYCFAWWSYILLADNLLLILRGRSLLNDRIREFWGMLPISVFIWLLFESYNFVIRNWAYTSVPSQIWERWLGYTVAFSTVLPGIFITSDLLELLFGPSQEQASSEAAKISSSPSAQPSPVFMLLGLILSFAPLIWPRYFFAAVWVGPILLLDPVLEKVGVRSLLGGIDTGKWKRILSLMLGGLICGILWEFFNYWAGSKWSYSVPFFGQFKVFEMPVLGFLGFPPFALECWILYHLLRAVPQRMDSTAGRIAWWIGLGIVSIIIFQGIDNHTVTRFTERISYTSQGG
jgi:hypothetical protein